MSTTTIETETIIQALEAHIAAECREIDPEKAFNDMLDECYSFEAVGGPFACMNPSRVLLEVDPTCYRCGVNDYIDGQEWVEIGGSYYDQRDAENAKEAFIDERQERIDELETEIEETEADEDHNISELAAMKRKLSELKSDMAQLEKHSF